MLGPDGVPENIAPPAGRSRPTSLRLCVAIATAGRPEVLADTLEHLSGQSRMPDQVLVCPAQASDVDLHRVSSLPFDVQIVAGGRGLPLQRNALIAASDADIMVFIDDDFLLAPDFLQEAEALMRGNPDVVVATGHVLADGILTQGLDFEEAVRIIDAAGPNRGGEWHRTYNAYGCNMIVRLQAVRDHSVKFDERLPLYAWQEDLDFSRQLAVYGEIVRSPRLRGVHLGTKRSGRSPGRRLGYSQVVNPVYLARKGTMAWSRCFRQIGRNITANCARAIRPESWVDRRGRLLGNLIGLFDLLRGVCEPERAVRH
ncbi:glycosyltransferase family 2 protein [Aurantimonas endophytica]|uniref:glycosyltransferase family 2 protein n=1 Tax=Aurantimonas endophytica TaxID=1522175 RepID=UPI0016058296|nr:glycosyltransferase [Aurantimonas endophytica]MCO6405602.1 glycosyltransferase [Aurantimonas endophytica]